MPLWRRLEACARGLAERRGFREIRPALLEETEVFIRSVGEVTDIVEKEMFTLQKGDTSLSLRPEGTAGIVRAYLQAGYAKTAPIQRLYHLGPMFRYERPQKGRERMFTQFDVEALGSLDPRLDAEIVHLATSFFSELGFENLQVQLNSLGEGDDRDRYREAVRAFLAPRIGEHCDLCQRRFERNVLRVLDCKNPACQELHEGAPVMLDSLSAENREHLDEVRRLLGGLGLDSEVDGGLVRGLDYYTRTVFEIHCLDLGARSAVCGGGRYDHLVRDLGGPDLGAVGFAIGFTPTMVAMKELGLVERLELRPDVPQVFVVAAGEELAGDVFLLAEELRAAGISAVYDVGVEPGVRTVKAQLKAADRAGCPFAVVLGETERERGTAQLKDLARREQEELPRAELPAAIRRRLDADVTVG